MNFPKNSRANQSGVALIMVLILVAVSIIILAGVMNRSQTVSILNDHNASFAVSGNAAEAAVEKVYARMAYDFQSLGILAVSNNMNSGMYRTNVPTAAENSYWSNFQFSDANGNAGQTYVGYAYSYAAVCPRPTPV